MKSALIAVGLLVLPAWVQAGEFNKVLKIGDAAPAWTDLEGTDGKKHSLKDLASKKYVVVIFTCNSCPVAEAYDRIIAWVKKNAAENSDVGCVAINVNTGKNDALPAMKTRADKKKFPFAYLYDPSQKIAQAYGANYTPEFFLLNADRKVVYMGALDDKSPPKAPTTLFLENALAELKAGKPISKPETSAAAGCRIKFLKKSEDD
jgi:peroxiredoxin